MEIPCSPRDRLTPARVKTAWFLGGRQILGTVVCGPKGPQLSVLWWWTTDCQLAQDAWGCGGSGEDAEKLGLFP